MNIFDLSNIKIEEKSFKNYDILDSNFVFRDNSRFLVLTIKIYTTGREINADDILDSFNDSKFAFLYSGYNYDVSILFGNAIRPISVSFDKWEVNLVIHNIVRQDIPNGKFKFALFNISNRILQNTKNMPHGGFRRSLLLFNIENISWTLEDTRFLEKRDKNDFILNGLLVSDTISNYSNIKSQMFYICNIISFITRKDVCCMESYDNDGILIETFEYKAKPFGINEEIINIFAHSPISELISQGYKIYKDDEKWWSITLSYFKEIRLANSLQPKMILACVLFERIARKFLPPIKEIIDSNLQRKKADILNLFDNELSKILDHWDEKKSKILFGVINGWDSSRSLSKSMRDLSTIYKVPELFEEMPTIRGALAHNGIFADNSDFKKNFSVYQELDLFLIILVLRKFGYEGKFTHPFIQNSEMRFLDVKDLKDNIKLSEFNKMQLS